VAYLLPGKMGDPYAFWQAGAFINMQAISKIGPVLSDLGVKTLQDFCGTWIKTYFDKR
jgi:hypothetical protein